MCDQKVLDELRQMHEKAMADKPFTAYCGMADANHDTATFFARLMSVLPELLDAAAANLPTGISDV